MHMFEGIPDRNDDVDQSWDDRCDDDKLNAEFDEGFNYGYWLMYGEEREKGAI